ncbi:MAG: aminoacyl-tRNA hydrolase [Candidatus Moranbacteria bacterium]|nr:aminoacyl-tRNA hydrolase [Candidatus Moranbacteria bacterium]
MYIIFGLGNPGTKYKHTRHNTGFLFLDWWTKKNGDAPEFTTNKKTLGKEKQLDQQAGIDETITLVKPQTFMNTSGDCVIRTLNFYKESKEKIIIIHDDVDILIGTYKIATNSRAAGHNGVQSIIDRLGSQEFLRLRIGTRPENKENELITRSFVLGQITSEEEETITNLFPQIHKEILNHLQ